MTTSDNDDLQRIISAGNALEDNGQLEEARQRYLRATVAVPTSPRPWLNLGNVLERQGNRASAIEAFGTAIAVAPDFAPAYFNLGRLLMISGDFEGAEQALDTALRLDSRFTDAALCLANVLEAGGRVPEAEAVLRDAAKSDPGHAGAIYNLGLLLIDREDYDEAESLMHRAIGIDPALSRAFGAIGTICMKTRRIREAESWFRRGMQADPRSFEAAAGLLFSLAARDDLDARRIFDAHREIARSLEALTVPPHARLPYTGKRPRIRVGYVSPDFRQHAVALFMHPVLRMHDRSAFDIHCYYNHRSEDRITRELMALAEHWHNIAGLDDDAAAERIRTDEIDILIDLAGYTSQSRLLLFARRCAPVQVSWLGYLQSTGIASMDYRICDAHTDPPGMSERWHSERLLRMPHSQWCYEPLHEAGEPIPAPAARAGRVVFGAFNQFWKISDRSLELWLEILRRVPEAELRVVGVPHGSAADTFRAQIEARGIAPARLHLSPRLDIQQYFETIATTDIALDTMPYNGATTTLDALWMGVPLVALAGDRSVARGAASILATLALPELIAASGAEYVELNVRLAQDIDWRSRLRATLRRRLQQSPLMDSAQFTRDLEALYREIHLRAAG